MTFTGRMTCWPQPSAAVLSLPPSLSHWVMKSSPRRPAMCRFSSFLLRLLAIRFHLVLNCVGAALFKTDML